MRMILEGKDCGFTWSASHLLPGHYKCSRMHGHNYVMNVEIESEEMEHGMIIDFVVVKKKIREFLEKYDHKLLIPGSQERMRYHFDGQYYVQIEYNLPQDELNEDTGIKIYNDNGETTIEQKRYSVPYMDVVIVHNFNFITAETLSLHFKEEIEKLLYPLGTSDKLYVTIFEDAGQGVRA